jgi:transcriptional regulator with XRE-family HTH domain
MPFADNLKDWRRRRGLSQLRLGLEADVSARHIAFLETGRSQPTRAMVIRLSEALEVPRVERNVLLEAAGFAAAYQRRDLDAAEMRSIQSAVDWTLSRHAPYPAFAYDRHWDLVALNDPAARILGAAGLGVGDSILDAMLAPSPLRSAIENWPEVAHHIHARLKTESRHLGGDAVLSAAAEKLADEIGEPKSGTTSLPAVITTRYRLGPDLFSFFSTIAQFGSAEDIALAELRLELLFPADQATQQALEASQTGT